MGAVFLAQQHEPVRRKVAIKLIRTAFARADDRIRGADHKYTAWVVDLAETLVQQGGRRRRGRCCCGRCPRWRARRICRGAGEGGEDAPRHRIDQNSVVSYIPDTHMIFPPRPATAEGRRTELLRLLSVNGYPNVFILGSHARYVTVYGQQIRALNLVSALARSGRLSPSSRVAVVGGGIAGVTAAAAAIEVGAGRVMLFESSPSLMRLQKTTEKRYIHPHIYDWPQDKVLNDLAQLPVLTWKAGIASNVVKDLLRQFDAIRKKAGERYVEKLDVQAIELQQGPALIVEGQSYKLDVVILAVGFGSDETSHTDGYWTDDDLGAPKHERSKRRWMVSGAGDGALTDLMRLCIRDFLHQDVLEAVDQVTRDRIGSSLLDIDQPSIDADTRVKAFRAAAEAVDKDLKRALEFRTVGDVLLNCDEAGLFEPGSSVLNRLITAWLLNNGKFTIVPGYIDAVDEEGGKLRVTFRGGRKDEIDRLVVRHGPKPPYKEQLWLRSLGDATREVRDAWRSVRQFEDWTREPLYDEEVPFTELSTVLRVDFGERIGCVIVTGSVEPPGTAITSRVREALKRLSKRKGTESYTPGREIDVVPLHIPAAKAVSSAAMYERTVRALCTSPIAIFDLSRHESAVMLLLGIRSAVRRGVTVVFEGPQDKDSPFNIVSLNPLPVDESFVRNLTAALESAFATLATIPDYYLDLPVYDAVRSLGDDYRTRNPEEEVLVLRWFDKQYNRLIGDALIRDSIETIWPDAAVVTTLDSRSPQLVEQRLYAAIRRDRLCIADWTGARPNVFFEIGVRLAVSEHDPVFILCDKAPHGWVPRTSKWPKKPDRWLRDLEALFGVTRFSPAGEETLGRRIADYEQVAGGLLSRGRTYAVVAEAIDKEREPGGEPIEAWLLRNADKLAGPSVQEGRLPVLYEETLKLQVRNAAAERILAAWHYLDARYSVRQRMQSGKLNPADPLLRKLLDVGLRFSGHARGAPSDLKEIAQQLRPVLLEMHRYARRDTADIIGESNFLKELALLARDNNELDEAATILQEADKLLSNALAQLVAARKGDLPGRYELAVKKRLYHIRGSIGGVYRRKLDYVAAARAYDAGREVEESFDDTYNLTQRLVSRVLADPAAAEDEKAVVENVRVREELRAANKEILRQINASRQSDEYAAADRLVISIFLGDDNWRAALQDFLSSVSESSYAREATRDVLTELARELARVAPKAAGLAARVDEALGQMTPRHS